MLKNILFLLAYWAFWFWPIPVLFVMEHRQAKRHEAMIRSAQEMELAEGVTLRQALRAYYGRMESWRVAQGLVCAFVGYPRSRKGDVRVNLETGEVMVYHDGREGEKAESAALVREMILAARRGERGPWP